MEIQINSDITALTDAVQATTIGKEDHDGLVSEKAKVETKLAEYCVKANQLLNMAAESGETEKETTALLENQRRDLL